MNQFYDKYKDYVIVSGLKYRIETDFRKMIQLNDIIKDHSISNVEKVSFIVGMFIDMPPEAVIFDAVEEFVKFVSMSSDNDEKSVKTSNKHTKRTYSFKHDYACITSAFLEVYRIDLDTIDYLHWHKFINLFLGLPETTQIKKIMSYRGINLSEIKDKDKRAQIARIQRQLAIHEDGKDVMPDADIANALF